MTQSAQDWSKYLNQIQSKEEFKSLHWEGSFFEYLELVKKNPNPFLPLLYHPKERYFFATNPLITNPKITTMIKIPALKLKPDATHSLAKTKARKT